jgi:hypothetical protein
MIGTREEDQLDGLQIPSGFSTGHTSSDKGHSNYNLVIFENKVEDEVQYNNSLCELVQHTQ